MSGELTREQVRVWLATVIHPLRQAVAVACARAPAGRWSFRVHLNDLEVIRPAAEVVAPMYHLNLVHFRRHRPAVDAQLKDYDERLDELRSACRGAFDWLVHRPELEEIAATGGDKASTKYLAEYAVNSIDELPPGYTTRELWQKTRLSVGQLWQLPDGRLHRGRIDDAGAAFRKVAEALAQALDLEVLELAERYGLPPVEPAGLLA